MGLKSSSLNGKSTKATVLFIGLDGSGKTTILKRLSKLKGASSNVSHVAPTHGFSVIPIQYKGFRINAVEVGGSKENRRCWSKYYRLAQGLVFVIDAADRKRVEEVGIELQNVLQEEALAGVPLLVYANKQDMFSAVEAKQLSEGLNLHLTRGRLWQIQACSARTGEGLQPAVEWLLQTIAEKHLTVKDIVLHKRELAR